MSKAQRDREGFPNMAVTRFFMVVSVLLALFVAVSGVLAQDGETNAPAISTEETNSMETLRTYLQLQEQLHATQLAIELSRKESEKTALETARVLGERLQAVESALSEQRARELEAMQSSNRVMLTVAGSFAGVAFLAMALMVYLQYRSMDRLAHISTNPGLRALPAPALGSLEPAGGHVSGAAEQSSLRLFAVMERLEDRIAELEKGSRLALRQGAAEAQPGQVHANGQGQSGTEGGNGHSREIAAMLVRGQKLLDEENAEAALGCFEEVLQSDRANTEALVKKGTALERLGKVDEALECYDAAIAVDNSMTIAFLHKGGLCNRMERFGEALACYEQALRTQEKRA